MNVYKDRILVTRGETLTVDWNIVNNDGSPFVVGKLVNPYFLLTVSSSNYKQEGRYLHNFWCPIIDTFYSTDFVRLDSFDLSPEESAIEKPAGVSWSDIAVYYVIDDETKKPIYKRWNGESYVDYSCRFTLEIPSRITSEWVEQEYVVGLKVVSGKSPGSGDRLISVETMQKINIPSKLIVYSNITGSTEDLL